MTTKYQNNSNGKRWVFSESTYKKIDAAMDQLCKHLKADLAIFADMNGYPVSYHSRQEGWDVNNLTALAAGTFSATTEMAFLIGEDSRFRYIFHEGERRHIYMCMVAHDYLMVIIFNKKTALGLVRALTRNVVTRLEELVEELKSEVSATAKVLDSEFKTMLSKELDKTFGL